MEYVRLGDIANIQTGPFGSQLHQSDYSETGVPVVMPKDLVDGKIIEDGIARVSQYHADRLNRHRLEPGNIVYARRGDVGRCAYVSVKEQGALCGTGCFRVEINTDKADPQYIFQQCQSASIVEWVKSRAVGSTLPNLNTGILSRIPLLFPPLPIQRKIASILSAYDSLIECNSKRIRLLEQMAENLYKEWFVRFRFPGHQNTKMINGLPEGWKVCRIGDVCETIGGGTPSTTTESYWNGDIKWVTPTDITSKSSLPLLSIEGRITEEGLKKSSAKLLPPYTLLMTSRASIGYFGLCCEAVCTNQGFISIIPNDDEIRMYLLYNLMSRKEELVANANGSTFLEISKGRFRKMKIVYPPLELLKKFNGIVWKMFNEVLSLEEQSALLTRQRDLLLPRLMSGKLEVCGVPK